MGRRVSPSSLKAYSTRGGTSGYTVRIMMLSDSKEQPGVIDDPSMKNGFYGATSVVAVFGQNGFLYRIADAFCCAENMVLQATELGISSCIIARGEETFVSPEGQELLREWEIPENY